MSQDSAAWSALLRGGRLGSTLLLTLGVGVHAIGMHLVATVLPSIVADLGGVAFYTWATMLYTVASIIGTACGGFVKATFGLRHGYIVGALVVLSGVVGCAVAPHMAVFLVARVIQGLGSGLLVALAYGIVSELYDEALRPLILSAISGVWGIAALLGPTVGGIFAEIGWWRGAFWALVPLILVVAALAWRTVPARRDDSRAPRLPLWRLLLLGSGVFCVALSGNVSSLGLRLGLLIAAGVLVVYTFRLDARHLTRLFPRRPFALTTAVGTVNATMFLFGVTTSIVGVFMPLFVQVLYGLSPLGAGYFNALLSVSWTVMALGSARLQDRRVRVAVLLGPLSILFGSLGLGVVVARGSLVMLGLFLAMVGAGIGLCYAHVTSWGIAAAPSDERTFTASALPTMQTLGLAFGASAAGLVANTAGLTAGLSLANVAAAATWVYRLGILAPAIVVVLVWRLIRLRQQHVVHVHLGSA